MIDLFKVFMSPMASAEVSRILESGQVAQGFEVENFEDELADWMILERAPVTVNSCTSALHLALHLADVGPGDEVVTTPQTCLATNLPILHLGATPVFADIDPDTGSIDPDDVAKKLTSRTKAIVAVDWAGRACEYDALKSHGVPVIEDAAHAVGTTYKDKHVAESGGDYVCFSFQAIKHLTCGDGGALAVPADQQGRAKRLRWFGLDRKASGHRFEQDVEEAGYKFHMNEIAAAIGNANIKHLNTILQKHRRNAAALTTFLSSVPGVQTPPWDAGSSHWLYTIRVHDPQVFMIRMLDRGVQCSPVHSRTDKKSCLSRFSNDALPGVDEFEKTQISIPVGWWLDVADLTRIAEAVEQSV